MVFIGWYMGSLKGWRGGAGIHIYIYIHTVLNPNVKYDMWTVNPFKGRFMVEARMGRDPSLLSRFQVPGPYPRGSRYLITKESGLNDI